MFEFVPDRLAPSRPLVLILHGCTQTAAGYDEGAGWSTLAERYGFALVFAQQKRANNLQTCFNWFQPEDIARDSGEAHSIRQMVEYMVERHRLGRERIYVTGLSAGGAMTMVMLVAYPDVFTGGAAIAGLPYGCAGNVQEALACMFQGCTRPAEAWDGLVRAASGHHGPWPKLSVWHGTADTTVAPVNADEIIKQWTNVHRLDPEPSAVETIDGYPRQVWGGGNRRGGHRVLYHHEHGSRHTHEHPRRCAWNARSFPPRCWNFIELSHRTVLGPDYRSYGRRSKAD